ncbi:MAG: PHP domain-containing protein, partial [Planctomycetota bacterium]
MAASSPITPLHVRSGHSLLRGTVSPETLAARAAELGHAAIALTDVNSLAGAPAFWQAAVEAGLQPLIGAELLADNQSILALIASESGYANLCQLITVVQNPDESQSIDLSKQSVDGLEIIVEDPALAEALMAMGCPAGQLWLGVDPACQSYAALRKLAAVAQTHDLPLVATAKALLASADDGRVARLLAAMRLQTTDATVPTHELPPSEAFLRTADQLAKQLTDWPEAIANNQRLVGKLSSFKLLPRQAVFPSFECPDGLTPTAYLKQLCRKGLTWRYPARPPAGWRERLRRELTLIETKGFSEYFLVVWDIVQYARRQGAPVAGRGSGASSLVAYLLGITNVCPLDCEIPFERFLNDLREDFPDLDIDFCWRIRDDVIDYATGRWGAGRVAMVCTHSTFQDRAALRETAKAMGFSEQQISKLGEMDQPEKNPRLLEAARLSRRLIGLPHNVSVHPGGIVMAPERLDRFAPLQPAAKGVRVTQFDKDGVEAMGLVKLDLLGNRSLSTIRASCDLIAERSSERIDPERVDTRDAATLAVLRAGDTVGCNQLESPAMRNLLRGLQPKGLKDVMKALALIRPGAASIGMKETFVRRHRGLEDPPPSDPRVDAVLAETYGVMLYEDDVMLLAAAMTGT